MLIAYEPISIIDSSVTHVLKIFDKCLKITNFVYSHSF